MTRLCDGAGRNPCPRKWECEGDCHFNNAGLGSRWLDKPTALAEVSRLGCAAVVIVLSGLAGLAIWGLS